MKNIRKLGRYALMITAALMLPIAALADTHAGIMPDGTIIKGGVKAVDSELTNKNERKLERFMANPRKDWAGIPTVATPRNSLPMVNP